MEPLRFTSEMLRRPAPGALDIVTTLRHFAIVSYAVPPDRLRPLIDQRFDLDCIQLGGEERALISVVPFQDEDFRAARFPSPRWRFGQTNYRIYVRDRASGQRAVWFIGTTLGSRTVIVPRQLWKMPWHRGRFWFDCRQAPSGGYERFHIETASRWAAATLDVVDEARPPSFDGFPDSESAMVLLTHPLIGYYRRTDGQLGSYAVWHAPLTPTAGRLAVARFDLLDRLGAVPFHEQSTPHSVLIQPSVEFLIHLPPRIVTL